MKLFLGSIRGRVGGIDSRGAAIFYLVPILRGSFLAGCVFLLCFLILAGSWALGYHSMGFRQFPDII